MDALKELWDELCDLGRDIRTEWREWVKRHIVDESPYDD